MLPVASQLLEVPVHEEESSLPVFICGAGMRVMIHSSEGQIALNLVGI